ncbi:hypothetical protein QVD17_06126 [Tagetes erecta]|uniref:C3H1-type domain-containing protein n=1 Tax=Tagetes erecta TaxID=13708 RepID=A0AAD8LJJ7_TARER|nr:hypothetical protein QVD17_06126 [Tagetes erecta]
MLYHNDNKNIQMDNIYGISNSKGPKRSSLSPIHNFAMPNPYWHQLGHVVDRYLSHDVHTHSTGLKNLNSANLRYLQPGRSHVVSPSSVLENQPPVNYMYHHSNGNRSIGSRAESPRQSRSALQFGNTLVKAEEDVVVFDGDVVNDLSVDRARCSSLSLTDSSGSSSSSGRSYKTDICLSYLENSGFCRYGSKCQFAHVNKEIHPVPFSYKSVLETPCKNYSPSGTCSFGPKRRSVYHETSTPTSSTTRTISQIKPDGPSNSTVKLKSSNWSPMDDDIEIQLKQDFEPYTNMVLYGPRRIKRLPVFTQICPE